MVLRLCEVARRCLYVDFGRVERSDRLFCRLSLVACP